MELSSSLNNILFTCVAVVDSTAGSAGLTTSGCTGFVSVVGLISPYMFIFGRFASNAWLVATTSIMANGSNTNMSISMNTFAMLFMSHPVNSCMYLITPNSLDVFSVFSKSNTCISSAVIESFNASILRVSSVRVCDVSRNCDSYALRLPALSVLITAPVFLSTWDNVVLVDNASLSADMSLSSACFSCMCSCLMSS